MTRLLFADDPDAARPAKNATAPGLPNQTRNHSKGRTPMLRTPTCPTTSVVVELDEADHVGYTAEELNTLIDRASAVRVAERLRNRATHHRSLARSGDGDAGPAFAGFHTWEAAALEEMAMTELYVAGLDEDGEPV